MPYFLQKQRYTLFVQKCVNLYAYKYTHKDNEDNILLISVQHNKTYTQTHKKIYYVA